MITPQCAAGWFLQKTGRGRIWPNSVGAGVQHCPVGGVNRNSRQSIVQGHLLSHVGLVRNRLLDSPRQRPTPPRPYKTYPGLQADRPRLHHVIRHQTLETHLPCHARARIPRGAAWHRAPGAWWYCSGMRAAVLMAMWGASGALLLTSGLRAVRLHRTPSPVLHPEGWCLRPTEMCGREWFERDAFQLKWSRQRLNQNFGGREASHHRTVDPVGTEPSGASAHQPVSLPPRLAAHTPPSHLSPPPGVS